MSEDSKWYNTSKSKVQKGTVSWILIHTAADTVPPVRCVRYRTESCRAAGCLGWCSMMGRQHNTGHSYTVRVVEGLLNSF